MKKKIGLLLILPLFLALTRLQTLESTVEVKGRQGIFQIFSDKNFNLKLEKEKDIVLECTGKIGNKIDEIKRGDSRIKTLYKIENLRCGKMSEEGRKDFKISSRASMILFHESKVYRAKFHLFKNDTSGIVFSKKTDEGNIFYPE